MNVKISGDYDNIMILYKSFTRGLNDFTENSQGL